MANNRISTQEELQNQITDLKAEILELSRTLSTRAGDMAEHAQPTIDGVGHRIRDAAGAARVQGQAMMDTVKENPGTASSIAVTAGIVGLSLGYFLGAMFQSPHRNWH
jgi:ElaB/YqjD/DUF883 family membrane-anchored ribosome-binding protein